MSQQVPNSTSSFPTWKSNWEQTKKVDYQTANRIAGVIFGQAIGDALGEPVEFGHDKTNIHLPVSNRFTDDTQMALANLEAILSVDPQASYDKLFKAMGEMYVRWAYNDPEWAEKWGRNDRSPGGTCMGGIANFKARGRWTSSGIGERGKGNGSAMRSSYVGASYKDPGDAFLTAAWHSIITHANQEAMIASGVVAHLCSNPYITDDAFGNCIDETMGFADSFARYLALDAEVEHGDGRWAQQHIRDAVRMARNMVAPEEFVQWNGNDFKGAEAVAAALYHNLYFDGFTGIVTKAVQYSGDADTVGGIAGAIAGARFGYDNIPTDWTDRIERAPYLHDITSRLLSR